MKVKVGGGGMFGANVTLAWSNILTERFYDEAEAEDSANSVSCSARSDCCSHEVKLSHC